MKTHNHKYIPERNTICYWIHWKRTISSFTKFYLHIKIKCMNTHDWDTLQTYYVNIKLFDDDFFFPFLTEHYFKYSNVSQFI